MQNKFDPTKMRVSFDLDEVLFVSPDTHKTEPPLGFPLNKIFKERLRLGTPRLINRLQELGYEAGIFLGEVKPGMSGGALFDEEDRLIGMIIASNDLKGAIIPSYEIMEEYIAFSSK